MYRVTTKALQGASHGVSSQDIEQVHRSVNTGKIATLSIVAFIALSGCSISNTLGEVDTQDELITSSVSKPVKQEGIASTDAELIKTVVADTEQIGTLAWQNPDTGNKGTITAINKFVGSHGQQCKKFQTTVDTFMGISLYNGETCELRKGFWVLSWFLRDGD
jgi:surface antigen